MGNFLWHSIDGIYSVYIADVTVSDVSFLRAGLANGVFGRNIKETTSDIAKENNAIFAINGDFYGFRDSGPVIRNGVLYRSNKRSGSNDVLAVYNDGSYAGCGMSVCI